MIRHWLASRLATHGCWDWTGYIVPGGPTTIGENGSISSSWTNCMPTLLSSNLH